MSITVDRRVSAASTGGPVERLIFILSGMIMGALGGGAAYLCYSWAASDLFFEHRWAWITVSGGLAFFMLRGAYFCLVPKPEEVRIELGH